MSGRLQKCHVAEIKYFNGKQFLFCGVQIGKTFGEKQKKDKITCL